MATGNYISSSDLTGRFGNRNMTTVTDLDNAGSRDDTIEQNAITDVEAKVNRMFKNCGFDTPISSVHVNATIIKQAIADLVYVHLYEARGMRDGAEAAGAYADMKRNAWDELNRLLIPGRMDDVTTPDIGCPSTVII